MTPKPSTSLRVRFAKLFGWTQCDTGTDCWVMTDGKHNTALTPQPQPPDPTDANTVREAMMGMTEEEWHKFLVELFAELDIYGKRGFIIGKAILQTPTTTLAELVCEVRGF